MNPLGVHALVFVSGWSQQEASRAIGRAAECGFEYLEIPLLDPKAINVRQTVRALEAANIRPVTSLGLSATTDISSGEPAPVGRGEALLNDALSVARDIGSEMLSGVLYSALRKYEAPTTDAGRSTCVEVLGRLAEKAKQAGLILGIEPVNRYESNVINSGDEALAFIKAVGADNIVVHLDSYHMNIEEGAPGPLIERLGDRLGYVHVNESHRGYMGTGTIDFDALFLALAQHSYQGVITFEAFSAGIGDPGLNADLAVWRELWNDPADLAVHAREFMTDSVERARQSVGPVEQAKRQIESKTAKDRSRGRAGRSKPSSTNADPADRNYGWSRDE